MTNNLQLPTGLTVGELFAKDPVSITDAELDDLVAVLRSKRLEWRKAEEIAKATGKKPKADSSVTLESLGL